MLSGLILLLELEDRQIHLVIDVDEANCIEESPLDLFPFRTEVNACLSTPKALATMIAGVKKIYVAWTVRTGSSIRRTAKPSKVTATASP